MYKEICSVTIPALGGACIVCSTMHLTNTSDNSSGLLEPIHLKDKPEIPEDELHQQISLPPPPPPAPSTPPEPEEKSTEEESSSEQTQQSDAEQGQTSTAETKGTLTTEEAVKQCLLKINTSNWLSQVNASLRTTFDIISTMGNCQSALQRHADESATDVQSGSES